MKKESALDICLAQCKQSQKNGWELVDYVTKLVHSHMIYSMDIPLSSPRKAFSFGKGYCVQQAFCMKYLLTSLGFQVQTVYCPKCRNKNTGKVLGHTWNRVTIDGVCKDVCSCRDGSTPGNVHFEPLGQVKAYKGLVVIGGFLGSIPVCIKNQKN